MNSGTSTVVMARRRGGILTTISLARLLGTFSILGLTIALQWPPLWVVVALSLFDSAIFLTFIPIGTRLAGATLGDYFRTLSTGLGASLAIGCLFVVGSYLLDASTMNNPWATVALLGVCGAMHVAVIAILYRGSLEAMLSAMGAQKN
jgi:hypothetical protein